MRGNGKMSLGPKRAFSRAAVAATIGMAVVIGSAGTFARAADDEEPELLDTKIVRGLLEGLGLRKDQASINYRERSPLVLPPSKELQVLPAPESDAKARKAAGWPTDSAVTEATRSGTRAAVIQEIAAPQSWPTRWARSIDRWSSRPMTSPTIRGATYASTSAGLLDPPNPLRSGASTR